MTDAESKKILPDAEAIQRVLELVSTAGRAAKLEIFDFLIEKFDKKFKGKMNEPGVQKMKALLTDLRATLEASATVQDKINAGVWQGARAASAEVINFYEQWFGVETQEAQSLSTLRMDYDISNRGEFLRGYSSNNQAVDVGNTVKMDALFNGWLVSNQLHNQDGVIYQTDKSGVILQDKNNNQQPVDAADFAKRFEDPNTGFLPYVHKIDQSMQVTLVNQTDSNKQASLS